MLIFYCCYGRAHSSVVAAALHLGWLKNTNPSLAEIMALPYFDQATARDFGRPLSVGHDSAGNEVFILGHGPAHALVERALRSAWEECGRREEEFLFVPTETCLTFWTRLGGFLSRRLGLSFPGRWLAAYGMRRSLPCLARCVTAVRSKAGLDAAWHRIG
ncbi:MAG TPA: DUF3189 family protein [Firmicutes bacterium]|nr:DUF3189 family protein [Bacillota bacterium]